MATHCLKTFMKVCSRHQNIHRLRSNINQISKRYFLSASYGQMENLTKFNDSDGILLGDISSTCLLIDRCSERQQPFTSLTIDRMVRTIEDRDDIITAMYYLYKFRHSDACYFLRPWTTHIWYCKCIEHDAKDLALKALDEAPHYGLFPDSIAFNMLLWDCLKKKEYETAFRIASHMFLLEKLDVKLSQSLCLMTILEKMKLAKKHDDSVSILPAFTSVAEKRNFGGICLRLGQLMNIKDLTLIGYGILGTIEKEIGIRGVYQDPWAPLSWEEGYFERGLALIGSGGVAVPHDVTSILLEVVKDSEELLSSLNQKITDLESEKLLSNGDILKILEEKVKTQMPNDEKSEKVLYDNTMKNWIAEHEELRKIEKKIDEENAQERQKYFEAQKISKAARRLAIEQLGYWELLTEDNDEVKDIPTHLRDEFVKGSMSDVQIERRRETDEEYFYPVQSSTGN